MAKIDINVNRESRPPKKNSGNMGNNRQNLSFDEDRERRFRQRMNAGSNASPSYSDAYDDNNYDNAYRYEDGEYPEKRRSADGANNKSGNKTSRKKKPSKTAKATNFLEKYGSVFLNKNDDDDDSIHSGDDNGNIIRIAGLVVAIIVLMGIVMFIGGRISNSRKEKAAKEERARQEAAYEASLNTISANQVPVSAPVKESVQGEYGLFSGYTLSSEGAAYIGSENTMSEYAIIVDASTGRIIAEKNGTSIVSPASMTKMMTLLVAVENISEDKLDDKVTVSREDTDYAYVNDLSSAGYEADEVTTVRDLMYGTILPSGGEAAHALAVYVSGSEEAFVELMNKKAAELGLTNTHFTNVSGFYNENHYSTVAEVAIILKACMENELCRTVMSAHIYTTTPSEQHPDGLEISNWFLRRIEDKYSAGLVYAAKTGYVSKSGNCCASFNQMPSGNQYICVTVNAHSSWRCIFDHVDIYETYAK